MTYAPAKGTKVFPDPDVVASGQRWFRDRTYLVFGKRTPVERTLLTVVAVRVDCEPPTVLYITDKTPRKERESKLSEFLANFTFIPPGESPP